MEGFEDIKKALATEDDNMSEDESRITNDNRITVMNSDPIANLQNQVIQLMSENSELKSRVTALEAKIVPLIMSSPENADRSRITAPKSDLFGPKPPPSSVKNDNDDDSIVNINATPSLISTEGRSTIENTNPFANRSVIDSSNQSVFKSNSAIAPQGYVTKKSLWGSALASLLVAATRYYITKTNLNLMMVDELRLMKVCTMIAPTLYYQAMHRDLPDTKNPATRYLSKAISRMDKNDLPVSTASDWSMMMEYQDGKDVLSVLNAMIVMAKQVPEAITHPVSQIISIMVPPVVRKVNGEPKFAISADGSPDLSPSQWEIWCSVLKEGALVKYIKYRLSGMKETQVVAKMMNEMRASDLTEKKNVNTIGKIAPFTMRNRSDA